MKYNFDTTPDHKTNASFRWGMADMPSDVIGMGTADLDYYCAPCIRETLFAHCGGKLLQLPAAYRCIL